jgi:ABC-2 type transport system permease protein
MKRTLAAAAAIFHRDLRLFLTYRTQAIGQIFSVVFSLALFYYISRLVRIETFGSPDEYFAFVVIGLVILSVTQSTLILSQTLRAELVAGSFERILLSPFGAVRGAMSMVLFPMVMAFFMGSVTILIGALVFHLELHWATVAFALPIGFVAALCFAAIAMLIAAIVIVFKQAPGMNMVLGLIALISGFYFPAELLPQWIQWATEVQPFTPAVELMRHFLVDLPTKDPIWADLLKLLGFVIVLVPIGTWSLARGVAVAQRKGTIIEY